MPWYRGNRINFLNQDIMGPSNFWVTFLDEKREKSLRRSRSFYAIWKTTFTNITNIYAYLALTEVLKFKM